METTTDVQARRERLRQVLTQAQAELLALLDRVGAEDWARESPNEGWTVRSLLTHLSTAEVGFVGVLRRMVAGQGGVPDDFDPNRWNAGQLRRKAEMPVETLRQDVEAAHQEMLGLLYGLDEVALDQRGHMSTGGEGSVEDTLQLVARHKRSHSADIRAALA